MPEISLEKDYIDTKERMGRNASYTAAGIFLSSIFGFLTYYYIGNYFGAGATSDAFFAVNILWLFFLTFASTFRYTLSAKLSSDNDIEVFRGKLGDCLLTVCCIIVPLCVILLFGRRTAAMLVGIGFGEEQLVVVSRLIVIMIPGLVFMSAGFVFSASLGAKGIFAAPAYAVAVANAVTFFVFLLIRKPIGIYSAVAGLDAGYFVFFLILFMESSKCNLLPKLRKLGIKDFKLIVIMIITGSAIYMFNEINYWILQSYSTLFEKGIPSIFAYSATIAAFIIYIISFPISVVSIPSMARQKEDIEKYLKGSLRFNALFIAPVALSLLLMADPVVGFLFGASFTEMQIKVFAALVKGYIPVVLTGGVCLQLFSLFYALGEEKHLLAAGVLSLPVNLIVLFALHDVAGVFSLVAAQLAYTLAMIAYLIAVMKKKGFIVSYIPSSVFPPDLAVYGSVSVIIVWIAFGRFYTHISGISLMGLIKIASIWLSYFILYGLMLKYLSPVKYNELFAVIKKRK